MSEENQDEDENSIFGQIVGSLVVDGLVQALFAWWASWIFASFHVTQFNPFIWWGGMTFLYVSLHTYHKEYSGIFLIRHIQVLLIATAIILIFL